MHTIAFHSQPSKHSKWVIQSSTSQVFDFEWHDYVNLKGNKKNEHNQDHGNKMHDTIKLKVTKSLNEINK